MGGVIKFSILKLIGEAWSAIGESNSRLRVEKSRPEAFETMAELSSLYIGVLLFKRYGSILNILQGRNELLEKIIACAKSQTSKTKEGYVLGTSPRPFCPKDSLINNNTFTLREGMVAAMKGQEASVIQIILPRKNSIMIKAVTVADQVRKKQQLCPFASHKQLCGYKENPDTESVLDILRMKHTLNNVTAIQVPGAGNNTTTAGVQGTKKM
ncbi:hypothetical protein Tco_0283099 [Tanacetum coccineum]